MENIIRQDIIQIAFDVFDDGLKQATKGITDLKSAVNRGVGGGLDKMKSSLSDATSEAAKLNAALKKVGGIEGLADAAEDLTQLNKKIEVQEQLCKNLNEEQKKVAKQFGETSNEALKLKQNLLNQEDSLTKMTRESKKLAESIETVQRAVDEAGNETDDLGKEAKEAKQQFDKLDNAGLSSLKNSIDKISGGLSTVAKKAAGVTFTGLKRLTTISFTTLISGLGAAGGAIVQFANLASDLEETKNKVDVAFGSGKGDFDGAASDVLDWSKKSTTAMGLAQQTALDTAALFGDMGTSMGLTKDKAAEMSMALTQQAADLASFKNMSIDEVTTALNGVFTGKQNLPLAA